MDTVIASASMSLDGYIAKQDNTIGRLFDWMPAGDVEIPTVSPGHHPAPEPDERRLLAFVDLAESRSATRPAACRPSG